MIKELTKNYLRNHKSVIICINPDDCIYDVEWLLINTYMCYYWNNGDYHQDTQYYIGNKFNSTHFLTHMIKNKRYFRVSYEKSQNILILNKVDFLNSDDEKNTNIIPSKILFREEKIKKLRIKNLCAK